jgi:hypothetical protein
MGNTIPLGVLRHYRHEMGPDYGEELEGALVRVVAYNPERRMYYVHFGEPPLGGWVFETELTED